MKFGDGFESFIDLLFWVLYLGVGLYYFSLMFR